jgi:hypothetical protein
MSLPRPYQTTWGGAVPGTLHIQGAARTLQQLIVPAVDGWVEGVRIYSDTNNRSTPGIAWLGLPIIGHIYIALAFDVDYVPIGGNPGWIHRYFRRPYFTPANSNIYLFWYTRSGNIWYAPGALNGITVVSGDLTVPADTGSNRQGLYDASAQLDPRTLSTGSRWGIDVLWLKKT